MNELSRLMSENPELIIGNLIIALLLLLLLLSFIPTRKKRKQQAEAEQRAAAIEPDFKTATDLVKTASEHVNRVLEGYHIKIKERESYLVVLQEKIGKIEAEISADIIAAHKTEKRRQQITWFLSGMFVGILVAALIILSIYWFKFA